MNITLTDKQIEALQKGEDITISSPCKKIDKWEPKGGKWYVDILGRANKNHSIKESRLSGLEYQTKEQAEKARDLMRSHNRQIAWLMENDDGWVADWNSNKQHKFYILYSCYDKEFIVHCISTIKGASIVYMSENNAFKLADLLNDGIVEF